MTVNAKKKVLVIDDDRDACELIAETLTSGGFDVFSFSDPDSGVAAAEEIHPDLVFISILFPQSNGLKISKAVHTVEGLDKVPVIMLISYSDELDPRYTSTIGIVDVALKPLKAEDILSKTVSVLGESTGETGEEVTAASLTEDAATLDEEWLSFLEKDREAGEPELQKTAESETAGEAIHETAQEAEDPLPDEGANKRVPQIAEEPVDEFATESKGGRMKKFLAVAAAVLVLIAGAAAGAFFFFHGTQQKIAVPNMEAPAKKEQAVAVQKKEVVPPAGQDKPPSVPVRATADSPASAKAAEKSGAPNVAQGNTAKPADAKQPAGAGNVYSVQVGAFQNERNAAALSEKLKEKGYDSFIVRGGGSAVQRVLIGRFDAPGKAAVQARLVLEKEGLKSIIYHY